MKTFTIIYKDEENNQEYELTVTDKDAKERRVDIADEIETFLNTVEPLLYSWDVFEKRE